MSTEVSLGDFQERFSSCLRPLISWLPPRAWGVDLPPLGGGESPGTPPWTTTRDVLFKKSLRQTPTSSTLQADTGTRHGSYKLDDYYPFALRMGATCTGFHPGQISDARPVPRLGQFRISGSRWGDLRGRSAGAQQAGLLARRN